MLPFESTEVNKVVRVTDAVVAFASALLLVPLAAARHRQ
jgi:hypothetical protein